MIPALSLRQESYGSNFTYQEHALHKTWFSAFKSIIITGISVLVLMSPLKRAVKPFLPKPGLVLVRRVLLLFLEVT